MAERQGSTGGPQRAWRIVLVISLALNLVVVGVIVGAAVSGRFGDRPPRSFDFGLGPVARALEPAERRSIGRALRRDQALRGVDPRAHATGIIAALRADPFDQAAFAALLAAQTGRIAALQNKAQAVLVDQIAMMSPDRREIFADRLQAELSRDRTGGSDS